VAREILVRLLLEDAPADVRFASSASLDWPWCSALAERWGAIPRLRERIRSRGLDLPESAAADLDRRFREGYARSILQARAGLTICAALEREHVRAVAFKGLASMAVLYDGPDERVILDADILIGASDLERAVRILSEQGFHPEIPGDLAEYVAFVRHAPRFGGNEVLAFHDGRGATIDLHWRLGTGLDPAAIIERAQDATLLGTPLRVVAAEDGVLLCAHHALRNHFTPDTLIRDLLDLDRWAARLASAGAIETAIQSARTHGLAAPLLAATSIIALHSPRSAAAQIASLLSAASPARVRSAGRLHDLFTIQVREGPFDRDLLYLFRSGELREVLSGMLFGGRRHLEMARTMDTALAGRPMSPSVRLRQLARSIRRLRPRHIPLLRALARSKDEFAQTP
jgi:hypothetical protein